MSSLWAKVVPALVLVNVGLLLLFNASFRVVAPGSPPPSQDWRQPQPAALKGARWSLDLSFRLREGQQQQQQRAVRKPLSEVVPPPTPSPLSELPPIPPGMVDRTPVPPKRSSPVSTSALSPSLKSDSASFHSLMSSRHAQLERVCGDPRTPRAPFTNYRRMILLKPNNVLWCPVFKASSSTWLENLLDLASVDEQKKRVLRDKYANAPLNMIKPLTQPLTATAYAQLMKGAAALRPELKSFLIVRHPFYRLVSAFRDKLERYHQVDSAKDWYYQTYGRKMVSMFRQEAVRRFGDGHFSEANRYGAPVPLAPGHRRDANLPIFWEFAKTVILSRSTHMDEHWTPVHTFCAPCQIHYDAIVKFESLRSGEDQMLKAFLAAAGTAPARWRNPSEHHNLSDDELAERYLAGFTEEEVIALFKVYETDFRMFGYTFEFRGIRFPLDADDPRLRAAKVGPAVRVAVPAQGRRANAFQRYGRITSSSNKIIIPRQL